MSDPQTRAPYDSRPFRVKKCKKCQETFLGVGIGKYCRNCNPDYGRKYPKAYLTEAQQMDILDLQNALMEFNQKKLEAEMDFEEEREYRELLEHRQRIYNKYVSMYEKAPTVGEDCGGPGIVHVGSSTGI